MKHIKKFYIVFLKVSIICIVLSSCNLYSAARNAYYNTKLEDVFIYEGDFSFLQTEEDISAFMYYKIKYVPDEVESWATPQETLFRGYGDCEDLAILYLNILYVQFHIKGELVLVYSSRDIVAGGRANHAIVKSRDIYIDPISRKEYTEQDVKYRYAFEEVFKKY